MRPVTLAFAGKLLVVPSCLLTLAACGDPEMPVDDGAPAAETTIASPAATKPEVTATPATDEPIAVPKLMREHRALNRLIDTTKSLGAQQELSNLKRLRLRLKDKISALQSHYRVPIKAG